MSALDPLGLPEAIPEAGGRPAVTHPLDGSVCVHDSLWVFHSYRLDEEAENEDTRWSGDACSQKLLSRGPESRWFFLPVLG